MSSAFGLWNVNSSPLTVERVKVCVKTLLVLKSSKMHKMRYHKQTTNLENTEQIKIMILLLTGNSCDFRKTKLQQDLFLVINNIHSSPIHSNNYIIFGKVWSQTMIENYKNVKVKQRQIRDKINCSPSNKSELFLPELRQAS